MEQGWHIFGFHNIEFRVFQTWQFQDMWTQNFSARILAGDFWKLKSTHLAVAKLKNTDTGSPRFKIIIRTRISIVK